MTLIPGTPIGFRLGKRGDNRSRRASCSVPLRRFAYQTIASVRIHTVQYCSPLRLNGESSWLEMSSDFVAVSDQIREL